MAELDERLAGEENSPLSAEEQKYADAALATISPELRAKLTPWDIITTVRGYQTYEPRLEETNKALQMIVQWREKVHFDRFLKERLSNDTDFHRMWPERMYGEDKYGHVVIGMRFEEIDVEGVEKLRSSDPSAEAEPESSYMLRLQGQKLAAYTRYKEERSRHHGAQRYKHIIIADLNGLGLGILAGHRRNVIKHVMDVGANFFPESAWKIFLINAPFMFRAVWAIVKPWIHPITVAKINILGSPKDAIKKMNECGIPSSSVPVWAGGTHPGTPAIDILLGYINEVDEALAKKLENAADLV